MGAMDLAATMDALAGAPPDIKASNRFAYPAGDITTPALIVGYPETIDYDVTFIRGSDRAVFPLWYVVGRVTEKTARDAASAVISGSGEWKDAIESDTTLLSVVQTARVLSAAPAPFTIAGVTYLAVRFDVEVYS